MSGVDRLREFAVKVANGSGCLFQPPTEEYTYVLTAKHLIENAKELSISRQIFDDNDQVINQTLEFISPPYIHNNPNKDAAIIKVKYIERLPSLLRDENPFNGLDEYYLVGHPLARDNKDFTYRHNKLKIQNKKTFGYIEAELEKNFDKNEIDGQSGGGTIKFYANKYWLAGIQKGVL